MNFIKSRLSVVLVLSAIFFSINTPAVEASALTDIDQLIQSLNQLTNEAINLRTDTPGTITSGCVIITRTLIPGNTDRTANGEVSKLQKFLKDINLYAGEVNGIFGATTQVALRQFQIYNNLLPSTYTGTSQVGAATRAKIRALTCPSGTGDQLGTPVNPPTSYLSDVKIALVNGVSAMNLGTFDFGKSGQTLIKVSLSGGAPRFVSLSGLNDAFQFTGGTFPGTGGTCSTILTAGCTISITMQPKPSLGRFDLSKTQLVYSTDLVLNYDNGASVMQTNAVRLGGKSPFLVEAALDDVPAKTDAPAGAGGSFTVVARFRGQPTDIQVAQVAAPVSIKSKSCAPTPASSVNGYPVIDCFITYGIASTGKAGIYPIKVAVSYNDGEKMVQIAKDTTVNIYAGSEAALTPEKNLLVVYNTRSTDGKEIADYYLANRPGFSSANVLPIVYPDPSCASCGAPDDEIARKPAFISSIKNPIANWIKAHPEKDIRHVVLVRGIPTRVYEKEPPAQRVSQFVANTIAVQGELATVDSTGCELKSYGYPTLPTENVPHALPPCAVADTSPGFYTRARFPGTLALFTSIDMGSKEATIKYIDKIKAMYAQMRNPSIFVSAENAGKSGTTYYLEDMNQAWRPEDSVYGLRDKNKLLEANPNAQVVYKPYGQLLDNTLANVKGFFTWGGNGPRGGEYPWNGPLKFTFTGNSNWYVIHTAESFNGWRFMPFQGSIGTWFAQRSFGGTEWDKTPVGAVAHADEPSQPQTSSDFFPCWENGNLFIDCAWYSRTGNQLYAVGDPWVKE